jgi:hypothetical protein
MRAAVRGEVEGGPSCAIIISGEVVADIDGEAYTRTAGEAVASDSRLARRYRDASGQPAHLVIAVTPPNR